MVDTADQLLPIFYETSVPAERKNPNLIEIHTSDILNFKRCRRKWNWQSRLRENLIAIGTPASPLWFGSGIHFAMEDFHGWGKFKDEEGKPDPRFAFAAYYDAFRESELPLDHEALLDLGFGMLDYYNRHWLPLHQEEYKTLWVNGLPQVEVDVHIPLNELLWNYATANLDSVHVGWLGRLLSQKEIVFALTFDRVVIDAHDRIFGVDYKTARQIDTAKLANDTQISNYHWALAKFYEDQAEGMVWQQHLKDVPHPPQKLVNGGYSQNKSQHTTHGIYRETLIKRFGKVPAQYFEFLEFLAQQQSVEGDRFIRRDIVRRNRAQWESTEKQILAVVLDMLDPTLPLYPSPTRDCSWDCPFKEACLSLDDGSDAEYLLRTAYTKWEGYKDDWRLRIEWPEDDPSTQVTMQA